MAQTHAKVPLTDVASSGSTILPVHLNVAGCATDEAGRRLERVLT